MSNQEISGDVPILTAAEKIKLLNEQNAAETVRKEAENKEAQEESDYHKFSDLVTTLAKELAGIESQRDGQDLDGAKKDVATSADSMRSAVKDMDPATQEKIINDKAFKKEIFGDDKAKYYGGKESIKNIEALDQKFYEIRNELAKAKEALSPLVEPHNEREAIKLQKRVLEIKEQIKSNINNIVSQYNQVADARIRDNDRNWRRIEKTYFAPKGLNDDIKGFLSKINVPIPSPESGGFDSDEYYLAIAEIFYDKFDQQYKEKFKQRQIESDVKKEIAGRFEYDAFKKAHGSELERLKSVPRFNQYINKNKIKIEKTESETTIELENIAREIKNVFYTVKSTDEYKSYKIKNEEFDKTENIKNKDFFDIDAQFESIPDAEDIEMSVHYRDYVYKLNNPFVEKLVNDFRGLMKTLKDKKLVVDESLKTENSRNMFMKKKAFISALTKESLLYDDGVKVLSGLISKIQDNESLNGTNEHQKKLANSIHDILHSVNDSFQGFNKTIFNNKLPAEDGVFKAKDLFSQIKEISFNDEEKELLEEDRKLFVDKLESYQILVEKYTQDL